MGFCGRYWGACEGIWSSVGISKIWGALKGCEELPEKLSLSFLKSGSPEGEVVTKGCFSS